MEPEGKRASLSDIAKEAGVDASTVSLVLNRKPLAERLRPETRRRIIEIAEKLRYRPSAAARSLRTGRSGMIGMVVGDIASLFYSELTATALANAERNGRRLIVSATEWSKEKELKALENLLAAGVDGIIFLPGSLSEEHPLFRTIRSERIPLVTFDRKLPGTPAVHCDYRRGFAEAVARLAASATSARGARFRTKSRPSARRVPPAAARGSSVSSREMIFRISSWSQRFSWGTARRRRGWSAQGRRRFIC